MASRYNGTTRKIIKGAVIVAVIGLIAAWVRWVATSVYANYCQVDANKQRVAQVELVMRSEREATIVYRTSVEKTLDELKDDNKEIKRMLNYLVMRERAQARRNER